MEVEMGNKEGPLHRDSMAKRVKQVLLGRIMSGELEPGTRLVEMQIARELETSQGPVREALCELEGLELVVTEPYKGTRVRAVTAEDLHEAYLVRAALEELAGRLAAPRFKGATEALKQLKSLAKVTQTAAREKNIADFTRHNISFHRLIVEQTGNRILLRTWDSLAFEVRSQWWLAKGRHELEMVQKVHWEIFDALECGDGEKAGALLHHHVLELLR